MSRVLRAAPLMLSEWSNILTSTEKPTTSKTDPPDRGPHRTQARRPRVPCDIHMQYGIISTLKIPAVSSGGTWTLSLQNFLWTCIIQVQSTFATDCGLHPHHFADDTQIYGFCSSTSSSCILLQSRISECIDVASSWMQSHWLQLNIAKTEIICLTTGRH